MAFVLMEAANMNDVILSLHLEGSIRQTLNFRNIERIMDNRFASKIERQRLGKIFQHGV
ncbi:Uncharacterised protein [Enterobacter cloacae]|uniref:Uncharacterized protein n=1 Tax=Enterobacter cloacae TaxID=550 RepID=A0A144SZE6_ENTCL|nr:Uncharacterised protein [Enterobacter cloacae]